MQNMGAVLLGITDREHATPASVAERQTALPPKYGNRGAKIMALQNISDAKHWRNRAAKMCVLSGEIDDAEAQSNNAHAGERVRHARRPSRRIALIGRRTGIKCSTAARSGERQEADVSQPGMLDRRAPIATRRAAGVLP
jgi:hypothetical protein